MGKKRNRSNSKDTVDSAGGTSAGKKEKEKKKSKKSAKKAKKTEVESVAKADSNKSSIKTNEATTTPAVATVGNTSANKTSSSSSPRTTEQTRSDDATNQQRKDQRHTNQNHPVADNNVHNVDSTNNNNDDDDEIKPFFFKRKVRLSLSLSPSSLHNSTSSIENCFRRMLLRYDDGLKGMLLAYDDIQIEDGATASRKQNKNHNNSNGGGGGGYGWILNELPYIHYNVSCTALVFQPSVGCELQGTVSQCFASHLSILVYGYVNAMIPSSEIRQAGYVFDPELETWSKQGGSQTIAAGNKVNFLVRKVHECDGALSMEGVQPVRSLLVESSE